MIISGTCSLRYQLPIFLRQLGGKMFDGIISFFTSINFEVIFQLLFVSLIMLAGPAVIFVLAFRNGDM